MDRITRCLINLEKYGSKELKLIQIKCMDGYEYQFEENQWITGKMVANIVERTEVQSQVWSLQLECIPYPYDYFRTFQREDAVQLSFPFREKGKRALAIHKYNPFWTEPVFLNGEKCENVKDLQQLLVKEGDGNYVHFMPLANENGISLLKYDGESGEIILTFSPDISGKTALSSPIMVVSRANDPYKAVEASFIAAREGMLIQTPLKKEKVYPEVLKGLGWCTWNAFYHDVTSEGIRRKMEEFRQKKIPVKWIMIDDGWSQVKDFKLLSFYEDRNKFPEGLKAFIRELKEQYGVEYVGIWHAFTGYWFGVAEEGELYQEHQELFLINQAGLILPAGDEEKAFQFYDKWHSWLREQGVDFLKVDAQGNALEFYKQQPKSYGVVQALHNALERSVRKNFGGNMINCMGMTSLDMYSRESSDVLRNSDDFFPGKEHGFTDHILQNAYNAVFNDQLYYCDFDMWWTKHSSTKQSCALRAISGGPIYISDKIGETDPQYLLPLLDEEGYVKRCDNAAKPTVECLFTEPRGKELTLFNTIDGEYVSVTFDMAQDGEVIKVIIEKEGKI